MKDERRRALRQSKEDLQAKVEAEVSAETAALRQSHAEGKLKLRKSHKKELRSLEDKVEVRVRKRFEEEIEKLMKTHSAEMDLAERVSAEWETRALKAEEAYTAAQQERERERERERDELSATQSTGAQDESQDEARSTEVSEIAIEFSTPPTVRKSVVSLSESECDSDSSVTSGDAGAHSKRRRRSRNRRNIQPGSTRTTSRGNKRRSRVEYLSCRRLLHLLSRDFHVFRRPAERRRGPWRMELVKAGLQPISVPRLTGRYGKALNVFTKYKTRS